MEAELNRIKEMLEKIRLSAMSSDERALFYAKSELERQLIGSDGTFTTRDTFTEQHNISAASISSTEIVVFGVNPTNLESGSDSGSGLDSGSGSSTVIAPSTVAVIASSIGAVIAAPTEAASTDAVIASSSSTEAASTDAVIASSTDAASTDAASTEEVTPLQEIIDEYQELGDCHRRIGDIFTLICSRRLFPESFLGRLCIIKLYLMTNEEHASSDILREINEYPERTFRVFRNGISSPYELKQFFGHSVLGWQDRTGNWFILDFLFMPISDVGYGMPLDHYLYLVLHNEYNPILVVPVVRHPLVYGSSCLDARRIRSTTEGVVDSAKNKVYPDIAESYQRDILREEP